MSQSLIGISPTPLNGAANFWSAAATINEATITADTAKIPKFFPGQVINFSQFNTYYYSIWQSQPTAESVNNIAVNSTNLFNGLPIATTIIPYLAGNANYSVSGPDVIFTGSTIGQALPAIAYPISSLDTVDIIQTNRVSDFAPSGNAANAQGFMLTSSLALASSLGAICYSIYINEGLNANSSSSVAPINAFTALADGDTYGLSITPTSAIAKKNGVAVATVLRTVTNTTTGGTLGTVGAYPANGTNSVDTTGLAPGVYTISSIYNIDQVSQTFQFEIVPVTHANPLPPNGTCWDTGDILNFTVPGSGTITSVTSLTSGVTGSSTGLGTSSAFFTISYPATLLTTATLRVTTNTGYTQDFVVPICLMLPPITNTVDNPNITTDDAANLPPSSIYQCVGVTVDARGPTFPSGDITWSILDQFNVPVVAGVVFTGQNTVQVTFSMNDTVPAGNYTLRATETATPTNFSDHAFTLVALPPITITTNQPYVGGNTQFNTAFPFPVTWDPAEVDNNTGLATWTTAGVKTVSYNPTSVVCSKTLSYIVYAAIDVAEYDGVNCVYINSGDTLALTVTGGSGIYTYSITGQNSISSSGVITAGIYAGSYTVSITDATANIIFNVPICIGSQSQFCTAIAETVCTDVSDPCCELSVNCGESISLSVPSFHLRINGVQEEVSYTSYGAGTTGTGGYLKSGSTITSAAGNAVVCTDPESLFEIVTNLDMADVLNAPFGIGFSEQAASGDTSTIDIAVVWYTNSNVRYVEIRKNGVTVAGSTFAILQGDVVSAGYQNGNFVLYINNLLKVETSDFDCCGSQYLDVVIEQPNKSLGGYLSGLTWTIITPGSVSEVGIINASGIYNSPTDSSFSLVEAEATVGNGTFRVRIRNIKPTVKYTQPKAFLAGKAVTLWVGPYISNMTETIRIAKDGSPDAIQNPGMIDTGTLEGSANFQEAIDYQDFENDLGQIYNTSIIKESATLAGTFLEVRDLYKLSKLKPEATLHSKSRGVTQFSMGGKSCDVGELRVIMVIGSPDCDTAFDVLYLPRVQNKGNLGLEVGKKTNGKYELNFTALPDYTLPAGRQLYSLFQYDSCQADVCS